MKGFDDNNLSVRVIPNLTTKHVGMGGMGIKAVQLFIWSLSNNQATVEKILLPVDIVVRESVKERVDND